MPDAIRIAVRENKRGQIAAFAEVEAAEYGQAGVVKVTGFTDALETRPLASDALRGKCAPLRQCNRASLLVNLPGDEMPLLIEMILDLGVN